MLKCITLISLIKEWEKNEENLTYIIFVFVFRWNPTSLWSYTEFTLILTRDWNDLISINVFILTYFDSLCNSVPLLCNYIICTMKDKILTLLALCVVLQWVIISDDRKKFVSEDFSFFFFPSVFDKS